MAKLYYGNGDCTIEGTAVLGVEIRYKGGIRIRKTCGDGSLLMAKNNGIIIVSLDGNYLNNLFHYKGRFQVTSVAVANASLELARTSIKRVMDYSEIVESLSEDMTINSENMSAGYVNGPEVKSTTVDIKIMKNQKNTGGLYYKDGSVYSGGLYHIHLNSGQIMSGGEHTEESEKLYIMRSDGKIAGNEIFRHKKPAIKRKKGVGTRKLLSGGTKGGTGGGY